MNTEMIFDSAHVKDVATLLISYMPTYRVFAFTGPLGAGKTTLIKTLIQMMSVKDDVVSPTFSYVNIYTIGQKRLYHFDLYRLHSLQEFLELGFDEYLNDPDGYCFIEWPSIIAPLLTNIQVCACMLEYHDDRRLIAIKTAD